MPKPNPSLYIREHLSTDDDDSAYAIWKAYRAYTGSHIAFQSFLKYVGMLKRLGLIEVSNEQDAGKGKGKMPPPIKKVKLLRIKQIDSDAWNNPYKALYKN